MNTANIVQYFTDLPADQIDQSVGFYEAPDSPCCVGAHLGFLLQERATIPYWVGADALARLGFLFQDQTTMIPYWIGSDTLASILGGTRAHLILMLRACGAGHDPFSSAPWPTPPAEVFQQLAAIETLPSLVGADLSVVALPYANLQGLDLSRANLTQANCYEANLTETNLTEANLTKTKLMEANLTQADLTSATLVGANLTSANLTGTNLSGANMQTADLTGTIRVPPKRRKIR